MKRLFYYIVKGLALFSRIFKNKYLYSKLISIAHQVNGVIFKSSPRFIHPSTYLDGSYDLKIGANIVISTGVVILTHDYSYTTGLISINEKPKTDVAILGPVIIGDNCFIGANALILPNTEIGNNCIIAAGAVVKGVFEDNSIIVGNPATVKFNIKDWIANKKLNNDLILHFDKN
jgi:acetyltransferase-like isoleucine patch superfamily enzyme